MPKKAIDVISDTTLTVICPRVLDGESVEGLACNMMTLGGSPQVVLQILCGDDSHHGDGENTEPPKIVHWGCFFEKNGERLPMEVIKHMDVGDEWTKINGEWSKVGGSNWEAN